MKELFKKLISNRLNLADSVTTWLVKQNIQSNNQWYHKAGFVEPFPKIKGTGFLKPVLGDWNKGIDKVGMLRRFEYSFDKTLQMKAGNCGEKSMLCFEKIQQLAKKPEVLKSLVDTRVLRCSAQGWDHAYVVVMDDNIVLPKKKITIADCGPTACVIDGWQHDWHFPNVTWWEMFQEIGLDARAGPTQKVIRDLVRKYPFLITDQKKF